MPSVVLWPGFAGLETRDSTYRPGPIPDFRIGAIASPTLLVHAASETATSIAAAGATKTCGPNDNSGFCEKYVGSDTETLPIVCGVVIPLVGAMILFFFLHRRHKKKLRKEDEDDAHKSLDFGLGEHYEREKLAKKGHGGRLNKNIPEMGSKEAVATARPQRQRGMSMDLDITNPYLLPPGLESSRESLHSLSRTLNTDDDKYRSTGFIPNDGSHSYPSSLRGIPLGDDASSFTAASSRRFEVSSNQKLLKQAHRMSGSQSRNQSAAPIDRRPLPPAMNNNLAAPSNDTLRDSFTSTDSGFGPNVALRASNNYLGKFISSGNVSDMKETEKPGQQSKGLAKRPTLPEEAPRAPEKAMTKDNNGIKRHSIGQTYPPAPPSKNESVSIQKSSTLQPKETHNPQLSSINFSDSAPLSIDLDDNHYSYSQQHQPASGSHSQNSRPPRTSSNALSNFDDKRETRQPTLPALDLPHPAQHEQQQQDHPAPEAEEVDYYDDYFDYADEIGYDPSRLTAFGERPLPPDDPTENPEQRAIRIRSFYKEYFDETSKPDPMPSGHSRQDYYDGSENYTYDGDDGYDGHDGYDGYDVSHYYEDPGSYASSRGPSRQARFNGMEGRHRTMSAGDYRPGSDPRAFSSASGRYGPPGRRGPPARNLPPPKPLMSLPTPHMLKDDSFLTHTPVDFAPPGAFKGQRAGTPDSLRGEMKPYRVRRAHIPLASAFDDLAVMPSPHALRKSSTFTALDFAPPPKIKGGSQYGGSDAGSVRSGRSNMSAAHMHNIRTGAYRVSRIPKEISGTRDEIRNELRPRMNMNR